MKYAHEYTALLFFLALVGIVKFIQWITSRDLHGKKESDFIRDFDKRNK